MFTHCTNNNYYKQFVILVYIYSIYYLKLYFKANINRHCYPNTDMLLIR